ncbi:TPA: antirestriction protein ArdA [Clostridium botulinum]|uniref:antirestriction protein ArdA n=1 Tax=Clostridium botulinum TaxID=1491 RepID=UPI001C9B4044|nr:antirestriction protein ArdA [Clostridium botulinum]MBY6909534.1 antirestriction protein ArdA [Clostridium botulinum]
MLNIYMANLGKYNEGKLVGEWLTLPCEESEIQVLFENIGLGEIDIENGEYTHGIEENGVFYEEYAIHDYETDIEGLEISEYSSISELNEIAEKLEELEEYELKVVNALIEWGVYSDIFEAIENIDDYILYEHINNNYDLGYYWIEESGCYEIPEYIKGYIDYEAFGRDTEMNGGGFFSQYGWIEG